MFNLVNVNCVIFSVIMVFVIILVKFFMCLNRWFVILGVFLLCLDNLFIVFLLILF